MDLKQIKQLTTHALANKIEYLKVDGIEIKFSPLAFVGEFGSEIGNEIRGAKHPELSSGSDSESSPANSVNEDRSSFDDVLDEDLLYHSAT